MVNGEGVTERESEYEEVPMLRCFDYATYAPSIRKYRGKIYRAGLSRLLVRRRGGGHVVIGGVHAHCLVVLQWTQ